MSLLQKSYIDHTFDDTVSVKSKEFSRMLDALNSAPKIYVPSDFWQMLSTVNTKKLDMDGFDSFKRSVNKAYFNWEIAGIYLHQLQIFFSEISRGNIEPMVKSRFIDKNFSGKVFVKFEFLSRLSYRIYVAYLYDYVSRIDRLGLLKKISEKNICN